MARHTRGAIEAVGHLEQGIRMCPICDLRIGLVIGRTGSAQVVKAKRKDTSRSFRADR
jgi:hypothetical protein